MSALETFEVDVIKTWYIIRSLNWICVIKAFEIHWFSKLFYEIWNKNMLTEKRSNNANLGFSCVNCNTVWIHTAQSFAQMWVNTCNPSFHRTGNPWCDPLPLNWLILYLAKHKTIVRKSPPKFVSPAFIFPIYGFASDKYADKFIVYFSQ